MFVRVYYEGNYSLNGLKIYLYMVIIKKLYDTRVYGYYLSVIYYLRKKKYKYGYLISSFVGTVPLNIRSFHYSKIWIYRNN